MPPPPPPPSPIAPPPSTQFQQDPNRQLRREGAVADLRHSQDWGTANDPAEETEDGWDMIAPNNVHSMLLSSVLSCS